MNQRLLAVVSLAALCTTTACSFSGTATITRNGYGFEAKIINADEKNIYVYSSEGVKAVPKVEVSNIVHPGHSFMIWGTILILASIPVFAVATQQQGDSRADDYVGGTLVALFGLLGVATGVGIYSDSVKALRAPHREPAHAIIPTIAPMRGGGAAGLVVSF